MRCLGLLLVMLPSAASARPQIQPFPVEKLRAYAPLLTRAEMAVIESDAEGHARQLTLLAWAAAPPSVVHDVLARPEEFRRIVRNVSRSDVVRRPDGSLVNTWRVELPIGHFDGVHEMRFAPGPAGSVDVAVLGAGKQGVHRWEFLPADGGGTVIVHYAFHDPPNDNFLLRRMLRRNPAYESGFALSASLVVMKSVQAEAARVAAASRAAGHGAEVRPPVGRAPGFSALLDRGTLAIIRSDGDGKLVDVSVVERLPVPRDRLLGVLRAPETWPSFLPSVTHCEIGHRDPQGIEYRIGIDGILLDIDTSYRMNFTPDGVDALGIGGDLRGSRFRWDLSSAGRDRTVAVYRGNARLSESSQILRLMFRHEPHFEHTANVAVGVITMRAMAHRALATARAPAARP